jgi:hypothetical protein
MPKSPNPQSRPPWRKTKLVFYTWWSIQAAIPCLFILVSFISAAVAQPKPDPTHPNQKKKLLTILLEIVLPIANLTLFYYLVVKLRAVVAAARGIVASRTPRTRPRGFGWGLESAVATEAFWMSERKGAGILLAAATAWVPSWGLSTLSMLVPLVIMGKGLVSLILVLGLAVGGGSCLGHLAYVWGRSLKVLVMGSKGRGREGAEEEEDGEDGERLLPLAGEERV